MKDNLTRDQMDTIAVHSIELPGTDIDEGEVRGYPYGTATAHIMGYVGTVSEKEINAEDDEDEQSILAIPSFRIGKDGVEKQYDLDLRGEAGDVQLEVNARGNVVRELARNDPKPGHDVTLGLDIGLAAIDAAASASQRRRRGRRRCLISKAAKFARWFRNPVTIPICFTYGISKNDWDQLNNDEHSPLLNKVISGVYAPGSTIKPIVALAGLEADMLDPEARVYCPGFYELGDYTFHCWKHGGHGHVNLHEAVAGSCDTYFYDLGHRIGIDRIQAMAKRFGFGQKLGIDLPHERTGFIPSRAWKFATHGEPWQQGETLIAAIGQGYMLASPLQLAVMAARIANGGRAIMPHLARTIGTTAAVPDIRIRRWGWTLAISQLCRTPCPPWSMKRLAPPISLMSTNPAWIWRVKREPLRCAISANPSVKKALQPTTIYPGKNVTMPCSPALRRWPRHAMPSV